MKIRTDKADTAFSQVIRLRDKMCLRCKSPVKLNDKGMPVSHTNSHYFGRGKENTRFDLENCDTLCMGCHQYWGSDNREDYREFKIRQLGEEGFKKLRIRAEMYKKKDRQASYLYSKKLLDEQRN